MKLRKGGKAKLSVTIERGTNWDKVEQLCGIIAALSDPNMAEFAELRAQALMALQEINREAQQKTAPPAVA